MWCREGTGHDEAARHRRQQLDRGGCGCVRGGRRRVARRRRNARDVDPHRGGAAWGGAVERVGDRQRTDGGVRWRSTSRRGNPDRGERQGGRPRDGGPAVGQDRRHDPEGGAGVGAGQPGFRGRQVGADPGVARPADPAASGGGRATRGHQRAAERAERRHQFATGGGDRAARGGQRAAERADRCHRSSSR